MKSSATVSLAKKRKPNPQTKITSRTLAAQTEFGLTQPDFLSARTLKFPNGYDPASSVTEEVLKTKITSIESTIKNITDDKSKAKAMKMFHNLLYLLDVTSTEFLSAQADEGKITQNMNTALNEVNTLLSKPSTEEDYKKINHISRVLYNISADYVQTAPVLLENLKSQTKSIIAYKKRELFDKIFGSQLSNKGRILYPNSEECQQNLELLKSDNLDLKFNPATKSLIYKGEQLITRKSYQHVLKEKYDILKKMTRNFNLSPTNPDTSQLLLRLEQSKLIGEEDQFWKIFDEIYQESLQDIAKYFSISVSLKPQHISLDQEDIDLNKLSTLPVFFIGNCKDKADNLSDKKIFNQIKDEFFNSETFRELPDEIKLDNLTFISLAKKLINISDTQPDQVGPILACAAIEQYHNTSGQSKIDLEADFQTAKSYLKNFLESDYNAVSGSLLIDKEIAFSFRERSKDGKANNAIDNHFTAVKMSYDEDTNDVTFTYSDPMHKKDRILTMPFGEEATSSLMESLWDKRHMPDAEHGSNALDTKVIDIMSQYGMSTLSEEDKNTQGVLQCGSHSCLRLYSKKFGDSLL